MLGAVASAGGEGESLRLEGANVAVRPHRTGDATLVEIVHRAGSSGGADGIVARVNGGGAGQEGNRLGRATVIAEGSEQGGLAGDVAAAGERAARAARVVNQVVAAAEGPGKVAAGGRVGDDGIDERHRAAGVCRYRRRLPRRCRRGWNLSPSPAQQYIR